MLHDIIAYEERITGIVIELHDVDIHLMEIENFLNRLNLNLVHVHTNNFAPIRADDDLPLILELTFSKYSNTSSDYKLPHMLDMPNNSKCSEYEILFNVCFGMISKIYIFGDRAVIKQDMFGV